jgi:hypothetical protein
MSKLRLLALAVLVTIASPLAGCSSGGKQPALASPSALATRIVCSDYAPMVPPTMFAREEGGCTLAGDDLDIVTFSDQTAEDNWIKAASTFGGIIVKGDLWAVGTGSQASADAVMAKIGGSIKS